MFQRCISNQFYRHILIYQQCTRLSSNDKALLEESIFNIRINTRTYYSVNVRSTSKNLQGKLFLFFCFWLFFFFSESAPLLAYSEHRCTRQEGFHACCWREAGYCTTDFPLCLRALTEVPKALTDRAYRPKQLRVLILSTAIKHKVMHFCQLHLCFC